MRASSLELTVPLVALGALLCVSRGSGAQEAASGPGIADDPAVVLGALAGSAIELRAERLDVDARSARATLSGDVELTLGPAFARAARVDVRTDDAWRPVALSATGGVHVGLGRARLDGDTLDLDLATQRLELQGNVRLVGHAVRVSGDRVSINLTTGAVAVDGKPVDGEGALSPSVGSRPSQP